MSGSFAPIGAKRVRGEADHGLRDAGAARRHRFTRGNIPRPLSGPNWGAIAGGAKRGVGVVGGRTRR